MPYIDPCDRRTAPRGLRDVLRFAAERAAPGGLNYLVTRLVVAWLGKAPTYEQFNAAVGALECAKLELYRRMVAPYEDEKCAENGDVYPGEDR
jgi:hypothetical protein